MDISIQINDKLYNILKKITAREEVELNEYVIEAIVEKIEEENALDLSKL